MVFIESNRDDINDFTNRVKDISDKIALNQLKFTPQTAANVHALWIEAAVLIGKLDRTTPAGTLTILQNAYQFLLNLKKKLEGMNLSMAGSRIEPVGMLFRGAPGVGKSNMLEHITYAYLSAVITEDQRKLFNENRKGFIYNHTPETEFWDGYNPEQMIATIYDDAGQKRDTANDSNSEWIQWIRMMSGFEYTLNMAALEKKGNVRFKSRAVIANTNKRNFDIESVTQPEAVKRRADRVYDVCPKLEFTTDDSKNGNIWDRRLDPKKLPIGVDDITSLTPNCSEFHEINLLKGSCGTATGRVLSYEEVVEELISLHKVKEARYNQYQKELTATIDKYAPATPQILMEPLVSFKDQVCNFEPALSEQASLRADYFVMSALIQKGIILPLDLCYAFYLRKYGMQQLRHIFSERNLIQSSYEQPVIDALAGYDVDYNELLDDDDCYEPIKINTKPIDAFWETIESWKAKIITKFAELPASLGICRSDVSQFVKNYLSTIIPVVLGVVGIVFTMISFDSIHKYVKSFWGEDFEPESRDKHNGGKRSRERKNVKTAKEFKNLYDVVNRERDVTTAIGTGGVFTREANVQKYVSPNKRAPLPKALYQAANKYDENNISILDKVVRRNVYEIWMPNHQHKSGTVTFVRGRTLLMNLHFATFIYQCIEQELEAADLIVQLKKACSNIVLPFKMKDFLNMVQCTEFNGSDACLIKMPRSCPTHVDIVKFFQKREESVMNKDLTFRLVLPSTTGISSWCGLATPVRSTILGTEDQYVLNKGYKYMALTQGGDCGGLFTIVDTHDANKIKGIHCAGSSSQGYGLSNAICQEDLLEGLKLTDDIIEDLESDAIPQSHTDVIDGRFTTLYNIDKTVSTGGPSKIMPSQLHGLWTPSTKAPCRLRPFYSETGEFKDPYAQALTKYCLPIPYIEEKTFDTLQKCLLAHLEHVSEFPVPRKLLTIEEAIKGIADDPDYKSISRSSSPGYPYNIMKNKAKGKTGIFGTNEEICLNNPEAREFIAEVNRVIQCLKEGKRMEHIYTDSVKDELRSHAKVASGASRAFSAGPLVLLVLMRMYFGSFVLWCQKNHTENGMEVGLNVYSADWEMLFLKLLKHGTPTTENGDDGDFSGFDGCQKPVPQWAACDIINGWYNDGPELKKIREIIFLEVIQSKHIRGSLIVEWYGSNPSGNYMTTLVNNLYNLLCALYVWNKVHDGDIRKLYTFFDHVEYHVFGDDNIFTCSTYAKPLFNAPALEKHLKDLGMKYTSASKDGVKQYMRSPLELSFLKRVWRFEPLLNRHVGPLSLDTILEMPYWTKRGDCQDMIVTQNVDTALAELALHPVETFNHWAPLIINASRETINYSPAMTDRTALIYNQDGQENFIP